MLTRLRLVGILALLSAGSVLADTSPTAINLESDVNPTVYGQQVTFTATVTPLGPGTPTGTVTFTIDTVAQPPVALDGAGKASLSTASLSAGAHTINAAYSGDANFDPQFTSDFPHTVNKANTGTATTQNPTASVTGQPVTFTATVSAQAPGAGTPTGTVTFTVDGTPQSPVALAGGVATFTVSNLAIGIHTVNSTYAGDANFNASAVSNTVSHTRTAANTSTAVVSSPNPSSAGSSTTVTATVAPVAPGAGIPTGSVTFFDGVTLLGTATLNGAGQAAVSVSTMTPGAHTLTATYAGDVNYNASTSSGYTHTVNRAVTTTFVAPSPNPSVVGQSVTLAATVSSAYPGAITGTVTFFDGATNLGTSALVGASATLTTTFSAAGSHSLTATYNGDSNYATSTSPPATQTVNAAPTTTTLASTPNPTVYGQSVTFTATVAAVAPGAGEPTGSVNFFDGATLLGAGTLNGSGQATLSTSTLSAGTHSITAVYAGSSNFATSTSSVTSQVVNQASTTSTLASAPNPSVFGQSVTFTATVSAVAPGAGTPTGSVQFKEGATVLGTVSLAAGTATFSTSALSVATHSVTAVYVGDTNFATSTSNAVSQVVNKSSSSTAVVSSVNPSVSGQSVTFTATVAAAAPGSGTPTGTVTFFDGATSLGTGTLAGGQATLSTSALAIGAHSITVVYAGDANFNGSTSSALTQNVNQAATTTSLTSSANPSTFGQSVVFTATVNVTAPGTGTPTGTVTFRDGASTLATSTLNASRVATFSTSSLATGAHSITATYNADANFTGSTSSALAQSVAKANTSTALSFAGSDVAGSTQTYTATVTSSGGTPTGTVRFVDGPTVLGTATLNGSGIATVSVTLPIGVHTVVATYNGDANFNPSTSAGNSVVVAAPPTTVTLILRSGTPIAGETLTYAATVTGSRKITGSVTFRDNNTVIGTAPVDAQGLATLSAKPAIGPHLITATYEGNPENGSSTSEPLFFVVHATATITLASSSNPSASGASVTFTATVASATTGGPAVTGSVSFVDGTRALGSVTLANGQASVTVTDLTSGDHTIIANYSGDTNYNAATSAALIQKVDRTASTTALDAAVDANGYFLTTTVRGSASGAAPTGSVTFEDATTNLALGSGTLADGSAMLRLAAPLPVGHRLRAVYAGDTTYAGSSSPLMPFIAGANAFSFAFTFSRDSIVSLFGADLADSTIAAPGLPLPATLGGVSVKIIDASGASHNASIYFVSAGQINIVLPDDLPEGAARLIVTNSRGSYSISIVITRSSPSLASVDGTGAGPAAAHLLRVHADGSQDPLIVVTANSVAFGAQTDSLYLILYGTGLRNGQGSTSCSLNGQPVTALYAGPHSTYPGLDQINLQIPDSLRGAGRVTISCTVGGQTTNAVTVNLQ